MGRMIVTLDIVKLDLGALDVRGAQPSWREAAAVPAAQAGVSVSVSKPERAA